MFLLFQFRNYAQTYVLALSVFLKLSIEPIFDPFFFSEIGKSVVYGLLSGF